MKTIIKSSFVVIGKEGSTDDGDGFIQKLWNEANGNFAEVAPLARRDENGNLMGVWGAMSDFSHSFHPWEANFSKGLYLAGVECNDEATPPAGWTKWIIPGYEYLAVDKAEDNHFQNTLKHMEENDIQLVGAIHDYCDPTTGKWYAYFPIRKN